MTVTLGEVVAALEARYDPALAEDWDAVGLVCGDPEEPVQRVLFAVDPVASVVDEVVETGAQLLVTHHPLFLTAVHGVPADDPKGRLVHRLVRSGAGLFVAHTNADRAPDSGVNDALAATLGLTGTETFAVEGVTELNNGTTPKTLKVTATAEDGTATTFDAVLRIDTPGEADYYRNGGILQYVLRQISAAK